MSRSLNGLSNVFVNTLNSGDAINIVSTSSTSQSTINVDISKESAKTTPVNTDLFLLEEADGSIKKITYQNLEGNIDTNFWTYSAPSLYPINTTDNVLIGTTSNSNSRKLLVVGNTELQDLYLQSNKKIISSNNSSDYLQFGNGTLTNNYSSNVINNTLSMGASADINLATGRAITRGTNATDRITFNSGNTTFGNTGIFNNSVVVKSTTGSNSGHVSFFEASDNGTNNIDLHCPETTTHDYNAYLPKITDTSITSVYILSNKNVLAGTNVSISNSTTDTITINSTDTNTEYTGGTNITLAGTTFNLDTTITGTITFSNTISGSINGNAGTATKIASITNSNIVQLSATQILSNKSFSDMPVCEAGLAVKQTSSSTSGNIRFFDKDNSNYIDLHIEDMAVAGNYNMYLPNDIGETVLLGTRNTQTVINKTLSTGTIYNGNTIAVGYGGTGIASYVIGDLLYASATATLSRLAIGSNNKILMSNGTNPVWNTLTLTDPLNISGTTINLGNLSGFGSNNQIIATNGSDTLEYRTLTAGNNITITNTSSAITISSTDNYWKRNDNISSFDLETTNDVDNIDIVVPFSTSSTLKTTGGLISGSSDYLKWVVYETNYRALESYCVVPTAPSAQQTVHFLLKNGEADYPSIKQNTAGSLYIHFENNGDCFEVNKNFEYGHKGAKWKYSDPYTYLYNPEDSNGASSASGSIMSFHKNGSVVFFNSTSTYSSGNTNYFSFAKSDDQQARITMDGNAQIAVAWLDSNDPSDRRIKYDIQDYENATEVINKIKIKSFMKYQLKNFNNDNEGKMLPFTDRLGEAKYSIGVIAQEIADIPELSFMVEGNFEDTINPAYIHNYIPIISLLVKSNQEQQEQIDNLTALVQNQQLVINNLLSATTFANFKKM